VPGAFIASLAAVVSIGVPLLIARSARSARNRSSGKPFDFWRTRLNIPEAIILGLTVVLVVAALTAIAVNS
jgi:hypothetical protein